MRSALLLKQRQSTLEFLPIWRTAETDAVQRLNLLFCFITGFPHDAFCEALRLDEDKLIVRQRQRLCRNGCGIAAFTSHVWVGLIVNFEHRILEAALPVGIDAAAPVRGLFPGELPFAGSIALAQGFRDRREERRPSGLEVELATG